MNITVKIEVTKQILDLDLYFWLNDKVKERHFRNCSNNKDSFEVNLSQDDILSIDAIIYAITGTDYTITFSAKREDYVKCIVIPESPIFGTIIRGNIAHELITIKLK